MQFEWAHTEYHCLKWEPDHGIIGSVIAIDTETSPIHPAEVPLFILGQAYAGGTNVYFIHLVHLATFLTAHRDCIFAMHTANFDISIIEKEADFDFDPIVRGQKLFDVGLLYRLWKLATDGEVPFKWALGILSLELLNLPLDKKDEIRCNWGGYRSGKEVNYDKISREELEYAAKDAIATYKLYHCLIAKVSEIDPRFYLSHKIQVMGAIALDRISRLGIGIDLEKKDHLLASLEAELSKAKNELEKWGYFPGRRGVALACEQILGGLGVSLPRTPTGKLSTKGEHLEPLRASHPFIEALVTHKEQAALKSSLSKLSGSRIHTRFTTLMNTGRTSSSKPNLQNLPRKDSVRRLFVPHPGFLFVIADYQQLEMCTLAQVCLDRFGISKMARLINMGSDLHRWFASIIAGKPEVDITSEERRWAKACNFGFPGGLGIDAFLDFARKTYGVTGMTEEKARQLKDRWLGSFPEMRRYLLDGLLERHDFSSLGYCDPVVAEATFKRIIGGAKVNQNGTPYKQETVDWAFRTVLPDVAPDFTGITVGSAEILNQVLKETVVTRTGRIRAKVGYCQAKNTPFQGLASDGAKIALYRLTRAGFRVCNFVHDEVIVEVPKSGDIDKATENISGIMSDSMRTVVPDVKIRVKTLVGTHWKKE